jgi:hypothetical protein
MQKFNVCIERECVEAVEIEVEANTEEEAIEMALNRAESVDGSEWYMTDYLGDIQFGYIETVNEEGEKA